MIFGGRDAIPQGCHSTVGIGRSWDIKWEQLCYQQKTGKRQPNPQKRILREITNLPNRQKWRPKFRPEFFKRHIDQKGFITYDGGQISPRCSRCATARHGVVWFFRKLKVRHGVVWFLVNRARHDFSMNLNISSSNCFLPIYARTLWIGHQRCVYENYHKGGHNPMLMVMSWIEYN